MRVVRSEKQCPPISSDFLQPRQLAHHGTSSKSGVWYPDPKSINQSLELFWPFLIVSRIAPGSVYPTKTGNGFLTVTGKNKSDPYWIYSFSCNPCALRPVLSHAGSAHFVKEYCLRSEIYKKAHSQGSDSQA